MRVKLVLWAHSSCWIATMVRRAWPNYGGGGRNVCLLPLLTFLSALLAFILLSPALLPPPLPCTSKHSISGGAALPLSLTRNSSILSRQDFPPDFVFGTASSAFQYEGAAKIDGRGPSIWDTFSQQGNIVDGGNADVTCDQYHRYKEDITLMSEMGFNAYRFSIAWPRLFPEGRGKVNHLGVAYYNNLINGLLKAGIEPYVTLYHWDLPQSLQDAYGGWLSPLIIDDFAAYADTCFKLFGDRVKHWVTFNEPNIFIQMGYDLGLFAPRRCSSWIRPDCYGGNSATEPYIAAHHVLLSYAEVADNYKKNYKGKQHGSIGMSISVNWYIPLRNTTEDLEAVQRMFDFQLGWFLDPLTKGDYPPSMRRLVGDRLPSFTSEQKIRLQQQRPDFVGINHYTTTYTASVNLSWDANHTDYFRDSLTSLTSERGGVVIGPRAASEWLYIVPSGIYHVVNFVKARYNFPIYITENGMDDDGSLPLEKALQDHKRVQFHRDYLSYLSAAVRDGVDVRGYFAWSLLDNFEWVYGYTLRFGLHYVDYATSKRYPKASAEWFKRFLKNKGSALSSSSSAKAAQQHYRLWLRQCAPSSQ